MSGHGLDDDIPEQLPPENRPSRLQAELFGDSDSEEEDQQVDEARAKRQRLLDLQLKKRKEQEAEITNAEGNKRRKSDLAEGPEVGGEGDSDEETPAVRTAEDDAFIDDEGVEPAERYGSEGEDEGGAIASEAEEGEEEDEIDKMLSGKGRKKKKDKSDKDAKEFIDNFLAKCEVAQEEDLSAVTNGLPAIHKLKVLPELEEALNIRSLHEQFLDAGLLGVLKLWLEPNTSVTPWVLPSIKVRTTILKLLQILPLDISVDGRKEQLKASGLGKAVMLLANLKEESPANKRLARNLVEKWSRPIFDAYRERQDEQQYQQQEARAARAARQRAQRAAPPQHTADAGDEADGKKGEPKPGQPGFRWHASVPQPARLDYVRRPVSMVQADAGARRQAAKPDKMTKKLKSMDARRGRAGKAVHVSVEGRGMIINQ